MRVENRFEAGDTPDVVYVISVDDWKRSCGAAAFIDRRDFSSSWVLWMSLFVIRGIHDKVWSCSSHILLHKGIEFFLGVPEGLARTGMVRSGTRRQGVVERRRIVQSNGTCYVSLIPHEPCRTGGIWSSDQLPNAKADVPHVVNVAPSVAATSLWKSRNQGSR